MDNQLGAQIAKLRRACGMTQETLGNRLGVSAAAVSKWETGAACPDVTLLCPLARALHTNVNALLAFEQRLTREQLTAFSETFVRHVRDGRQREAQENMARLLMEYPGDTALRLNCAALISVLEMSFPDESEETKAAWHDKRRALYEEAALSENVAERESASCALASMDLAEGRLDAAQARLDALPESREDTTLLRVRLLKKRGEDGRALEVVQKQLYRAVAQTLERLTLLMEAQTDAHDALQIAQIYRQVEAIFSAGGGMSDGLMMEQYLKLGETDAALCCLKRLADVAVGPAMTPNPILFAPTISPRMQENQMPRAWRAMLLRGLREEEALAGLRETPIYRDAVSRLEESLK